jgi:hypothetical protein
MATLKDIRLKVRRVTKSPSSNQITDQQIDDYINTFYIYDFPEHLRTFSLRQNLTFMLEPNIDTYDFPVGNPIDVPNTSIGSAVTNIFSVNIFDFLGIGPNIKIIPGSIDILVNNPNTATFQENFPYSGQLSGTGSGTNGIVDYFTGNLTLFFSIAMAGSGVTISFQYSYPEWITVHPPLYIAGYESYYTQSQSEFYRVYPIIRTIQQIAVGDGTSGPYNFILQAIPVLRNQVSIDSIDSTSGVGQSVRDDGLGNLVGDGTGTINYVNGIGTVTFHTAVSVNAFINSQTVPYVAQRPASALFFADKFVFRPVPDQAYQVQIEAYKRPTALMAVNQMPELAEWWQYLAVGAAMKIFEDRGDFQSMQNYMPVFKEYQALVLRRTIVQQTNDRTQTIYTEMTQYGFGNFVTPF